MEFKVSDFKPMNRNTLRGFFSLTVGPLVISGSSYHVMNDKSWENPPSREFTDAESGEKRYSQIIRIPDE